MGITRFPHGVSSFGIPIIGSGPVMTTGKVFFVGPSGSNGNSGESPEQPFSTIDYAIGMCTANKGDIIFVMPGHAESVTSAGAIDCDVAGISIIGLGNGSSRPTITFSTSTSADIDIDAADITIANMNFVCAIDSLAAAIDVNAAGFTLKNCLFNYTSTNDCLIWVITDANADNMTIEDCQFFGDHAGPTECIRLVGADRARIERCVIVGNYSTSAINGITTASYGITIKENELCNSNAAGFLVDLVAGCTGTVTRNSCKSGYATDLSRGIDPASCAASQNYVTNDTAESGALVPTTVSS